MDLPIDPSKGHKVLFDVLNDGSLKLISIQGNDYRLLVEIDYLAEYVKTGTRDLILEIYNVTGLSLEHWDDEKTTCRDVNAVFALSPGILSALAEPDGSVIVYCDYLPAEQLPAIGGTLRIRFDSFQLYTEDSVPVTFDQVKDAASRHWNDFRTRNSINTTREEPLAPPALS